MGRGHGRRRARGGQRGHRNAGCPLYFESFPPEMMQTVPNALLNEDWKCRRCSRLVASHESRSDSAYGRFVTMIPEDSSPDQILELFPLALTLASRNANGWSKIGSHREASDSTAIRNPVLEYYGLHKKHCQILGPETKHVVNAHIWPYHNRENLDLMKLEEADIDKPENILRLHKTIEYNFDHLNIFFEDTGGNDRQLLLKVLNPDARTTVLLDTDPQLTLQDVEGIPLAFPIGSMPWNRLLGMHAHFALGNARTQGWLPEDQFSAAQDRAMNLLEFSIDDEAASRIKRWIESRQR